MSDDESPLLALDELETHYVIREGWLQRQTGRVRAVDGVSFSIEQGEALGLVGESGSGKSTVARTILQLEEATDGDVRFEGETISELSGEQLRSFQRRVQLVVQDPNEAFSPRMTIGEAVAEPLRLHGLSDGHRREEIVEDLLERVGLSADDTGRYPHEFSGGEKQRIAIARALITNPDLIIADEPTSALDSRVQSDVLALLARIREEYDVAVLLISHDIDVIRLFCDRVAVMYLGEIVERGPVETVLNDPAHPYTRVLLGSVPSLDPADRELARPLTETIPDPADPPTGCRFHTRCPELIPPTGIDLPTAVWRAVVEFRFTLQAGTLPDAVADATDPQTVRDQFAIPDPVGESAIETAVETATEAVVEGELGTATEELAAVTETVCERESPAASTDGRPVACHRYDEAVEGEPLIDDTAERS